MPKLQSLRSELLKFLKEDQILSSDLDLKLYDSDATSLFKNKGLAVVLANNADEILATVRAINKLRSKYPELNFLARAAGTGLSGGAIGNPNSVIISTSRLTRVLEIDEKKRIALVETGLVNAELNTILAQRNSNLHFAPDPSSQTACTLGGNIAENAGGIHCYKYGVTSDHVLGLELILPTGELVYLGALRASGNEIPNIVLEHGSGPNLTRLVVGSESTFGIVTKALVKLIPKAEFFITMQLSFVSVQQAALLVKSIIGAGFKPAALELIDAVAIEAVDKAYNLGINKSHKVGAILLIELDGDQEEVELESRRIHKLIKKETLLHYEESSDPKRKQELWKIRKGVAAAFGQIAPYWYLYDAVVPRSRIPEALSGIEAISNKHKLLQAGMAHAADGNLHPNFLYDPDKDPTVIDRIFKASHEIMQLCVDVGGTLSGGHGIGLEKREYMDYLWSPEDMNIMLKVRKAFDPEHIANPDKIFPLRICKEHFGHCEEVIR